MARTYERSRGMGRLVDLQDLCLTVHFVVVQFFVDLDVPQTGQDYWTAVEGLVPGGSGLLPPRGSHRSGTVQAVPAQSRPSDSAD
jgi:hypothetical protein